jgi:hypothetical protein
MPKTIISARIEANVLADVRNTGTPMTSAIEQGLVWWLRRQRKRTATIHRQHHLHQHLHAHLSHAHRLYTHMPHLRLRRCWHDSGPRERL